MVPDELVQDLEDDRVVLFCGAGISMGAGLPNYNGLVREAYNAMGEPTPDRRSFRWKWPDRMLGELEARSIPGGVRNAVATLLSKTPTDVGLHKALLRLATLSRHRGLRLVTTNFDTFFETANPKLQRGTDLHSGPVLPIPRNDYASSWRSVVHLHGRLEPVADGNAHLIMTSADFGRAYLTDGWAARFVCRLFADFSVLFVGYSVDDPVMRYMTDAFAAEALAARRRSARPAAYIFASYKGKAPPKEALDDWRHRGLEPIFYNEKGHHRLLRETIEQWAKAREDWISDTTSLVNRLAGSSKPVAGLPRRKPGTPQQRTPSETANLLWALFGRPGDADHGLRTFANLEPPASGEWLATFNGYERGLLKAHQQAMTAARDNREPAPPPPSLPVQALVVAPGEASVPFESNAFLLARWLCRRLDEPSVIEWVTEHARSGRRLHPTFRDQVRRSLGSPERTLTPGQRRFWRLVSSEAPWMDHGSGPEIAWTFEALLAEPGSEGVTQVQLLALLSPCIRLSPRIWTPDWIASLGIDEASGAVELGKHFSAVAEAEVKLMGGDGVRLALQSFDLLPDADVRLASMTDDLTSTLKLTLDLWTLVHDDPLDGDPGLHHRPSIVPHSQNFDHYQWTTLIDLLWRGWVSLDGRDSIGSRRLVSRWISLKYPTFRRMALAAIGRSSNWSAREKVEMLLDGF